MSRAQIPDFVRELGEENALSKQLKLLQASLEASLHVIWVFGLASVIEAHHKRLDCNQRSVHGQRALCPAVENNQLGTVKALLTHRRCNAIEFNVKAIHQLQQRQFSPVVYYASALQAAATQGSTPISQTLLDHGAKIFLVAGYYGSALLAACYAGNEMTVEFLLAECNADLNSQGGYRLQLEATFKLWKCCLKLEHLKCRAAVDAEGGLDPFKSLTDDRNYNPLHYCAFHGHRTRVEPLLRHAFGDGRFGGEKNFEAFVSQQGSPDLITPLHDATVRGWRDIAMLLLEMYGADYEVYGVHGDSVLPHAVQANHDELLEPYMKFMSGDVDQE
ncbi:MAG: hypothetical protein Q9177_003982 [Variospora cf. flavescens]